MPDPTYLERLASIDTKLDHLLEWIRAVSSNVDRMADHEVRITSLEESRRQLIAVANRILVAVVVAGIFGVFSFILWVSRSGFPIPGINE